MYWNFGLVLFITFVTVGTLKSDSCTAFALHIPWVLCLKYVLIILIIVAVLYLMHDTVKLLRTMA